MPKYIVLDKDTIKNEIMPYLSVAKRGYVSQGSLIEVVNAILHKLKSGCQWHQLPVEHLFGDVVLSWNAVYHHFRKWCRLGEWQSMFAALVRKYKDRLDMSVTHIDGSHTPALKGGESHEIIANVCPNPRNGEPAEDYLFDDELYKERFVIVRTNAWMDGFRSILTRFDTTVSSWKGWNYLAFAVVFLKKFTNHKSLNEFNKRNYYCPLNFLSHDKIRAGTYCRSQP